MPSFKVPCPSCEAPVLIKDQKLIGTKTECPKCKYRFKVEEPTGGVAEDEAKPAKGKKGAPAEVDEIAKKKKQKKLLAIGGAVVAVGVLAAVGFALMGGGSDNKPIAKGGGGGGGVGGPKGGVTPPGTTGPGTTNSKDNKSKEDAGKKDVPKDPPSPAIPASDRESTNLLPGETLSLYRFDLDKIRQTPISPLTDPVLLEMFKNSFGFDADSVVTYYHAFVGAGRDPFGVMRLRSPVSEKEIIARMSLSPDSKTVRGRVLYAFQSNPFINAVAHTCSLSSLFADVYAKTPPAAAATPSSRVIGVCVYDSQHILLGDFALLDKYLNELEVTGYPKYQSSVKPPPGSNLMLAEKPLYLTIDPQLKQMLKGLDAETGNPPAAMYVEKLTQGMYDPKLFKPQFQPIAAVLDPVLNRTTYLGANLLSFTSRELVATLKLIIATESEALNIAKNQLTPGLTLGTEAVSLFLGSPVEFRNQTPGVEMTPGVGPGTPGIGPGPGPGPGPGLNRPGPGGGPGFGPGPGPGQGPGGMKPPSGFPGGPGQGPGPGPGPGPGSGRPGGLSGTGGPPGPGNLPGTPGATPPPPSNLPQSIVTLQVTDQLITLKVDMLWTNEAYNRTLAPPLFTFTSALKGKIAVYASDLSFHGLASAIPRMSAKTLAFPRGAFDRQVTDITRRGLKYPPSTRVSFFAELLPFMGRGNLRNTIDTEKAWFDEVNLPAAEAWVPEFLVPTYPQSAWRATSPYVHDGRRLGGTNYVGIAGVGVDAARFDPNSPADAKKVGLVGYDWGSRVSDVSDGLGNTIYMMQTSPGMSQPWIAGGGATLRGLNEADPMQGFRHANPNGQSGTYALMGDGSVRWIKGDINPKVLLAMGTRAGGENLAELDKEAPRVDGKKAEMEAKAETKPAPPEPDKKAAPEKAAPDKKAEPAPSKEPAPSTPKLEVAPPPRGKS
jgi:hypothetical protein